MVGCWYIPRYELGVDSYKVNLQRALVKDMQFKSITDKSLPEVVSEFCHQLMHVAE